MKSVSTAILAFFLLIPLAGTDDWRGNPLEVDNNVINSWEGGTVNFFLDAGPSNKDRGYLLLSTASGTIPGFNLPNGGLNMPINWDPVTDLAMIMGFPGFAGQLDGTGKSTALFSIPHTHIPGDVTLSFAYALQGPPWDFASNPVDVLLKDWYSGTVYMYDDGSTEFFSMSTLAGETCWMHAFDAAQGDVIEIIATAFGSKAAPGHCPPNGTPARVFLWEDPNDDWNPDNLILMAEKKTTVQNVDTDILNELVLDKPVFVKGVFFIGASVPHGMHQFPAPVDASNPFYNGEAWLSGAIAPDVFDPNDLDPDATFEMGNVGFPIYWLLRAYPF